MRMKIAAILLSILVMTSPLYAQTAVIKAVDTVTGATTDVGNNTDHAIRVTQASGGSVWTFNWTQILGAAPSATNPVPSRLTDGSTYIDPRSIRLLTNSDTVTAVQTTGSNLHVNVDATATQIVTGNISGTTPVVMAFTQPSPSTVVFINDAGHAITMNIALQGSMDGVTYSSLWFEKVSTSNGGYTGNEIANDIASTGAFQDWGQYVVATGGMTHFRLNPYNNPGGETQAYRIVAYPFSIARNAVYLAGANGTMVPVGGDHSLQVSLTTGTQPMAVGAGGEGGSNTLRVSIADGNAPIGSVIETAPATDTASSGLNGRMQRIAQRLTTSISSLTSIDGKTPALGQALAAASVPVVLTAAQVTTLTPPTTVAVTSAGLSNLDVALSTRTKPADQQHTIIDSGTTVVTQPTGTNLHTVVDSATSLPLPTGASTSTLQTTLNNHFLTSVTTTGTINTVGGTVVASALGTVGNAVAIVNISGTFTGPLNFQWTSGVGGSGTLAYYNLSTGITAGIGVNTITSIGTYAFDVSGIDTLTIFGPTATGTATVRIVASATPYWYPRGTQTTQFSTRQPFYYDDGSNTLTLAPGGTAVTGAYPAVPVGLSPTSPLPAGTNALGHVITDTGSTTAVTGSVAVTSTGLTNLDIALSALRDALTGVSARTLTDAYTQLTALITELASTHIAPGTTAPTKVDVVAGITNDVTPQYQPLPLQRGGGAVIVAPNSIPLPPSQRCNALRRTNCIP